jgi:hypothetical protein
MALVIRQQHIGSLMQSFAHGARPHTYVAQRIPNFLAALSIRYLMIHYFTRPFALRIGKILYMPEYS